MKKKKKRVRCKWHLKSYAGHPLYKTEKITLKKKILNNAFETIVADANHNYVLDPMNKVYRGQKHLLAHQFRYSFLKSLDAEKLTGFNIINLQIRFHNFIVRLTKED